MMKYRCPCCGYYTFPAPLTGNYDICPVCFWEDDPFQSVDPSVEVGANSVCLLEAQQNFREFGACERKMIPHVRAPLPDEYIGAD